MSLDTKRWAPWWAYLVPILAFNYLRQWLIAPGDVGDVVSIALFVAVTVAVAIVITLVHKLLSPAGEEKF